MNDIRKPFDPALFLENDQLCRAAVLAHCHREGIHCIENPDLYGPDLVVYSGFRPSSYIEVERKRIWQAAPLARSTDQAGLDITFPWPTVQLPERKAKFLRKRLPVEFWILDNSCRYAVVIPETTLSSSPLVIIPNSQIAEGEKFFQIPVSECSIKSLVD